MELFFFKTDNSPMRSPIFTMVSAPCNVFRIRSLSGKTLSGSRSSTTVEPPNSNLPFSSPRFTWQRSFFIIPDLSDHQCTNFHHQDSAEFFIFTRQYSLLFILCRADIICNRIYSVKNSRNPSEQVFSPSAT